MKRNRGWRRRCGREPSPRKYWRYNWIRKQRCARVDRCETRCLRLLSPDHRDLPSWIRIVLNRTVVQIDAVGDLHLHEELRGAYSYAQRIVSAIYQVDC